MLISAGLLVDQPPVHRPARQLVAAGELELAQHGRHMSLDGLRRDAELDGDLLVHVPARDVLEHLALARRQQVQLRVHLRGRDLTGEGVEYEAGQARREHGVAIAHAAHRVGQLGGGDRLRHVAASTRADQRDHVLSRVADREREKANGRAALANTPDHLRPAAPRHVDIEQDDVRLELLDRLHGALHVAALSYDLDLLAETRAHTCAEEVVIVDDHDPGHRSVAHGLSSRSIVISTSVPAPGKARTVALPPARRIRPTIDSRTPRLACGTAAVSKPAPRSRTNTWMRSPESSA